MLKNPHSLAEEISHLAYTQNYYSVDSQVEYIYFFSPSMFIMPSVFAGFEPW